MSYNFYEKEADKNNYIYFEKVTDKKVVSSTPHFHDSIEIMMMKRGKSAVYVNGSRIELSEGDIAFIDSFDVHYYDYFDGSEYYVLLVSRKYFDEINRFDKNALDTFLPKCDKHRQITELFEIFHTLWKDKNEAFQRGLANSVLGILVSRYPLRKREPKGEVRTLVDTLIFINEHFSEKITLELLSKKFGYSKNYFSSLFNKFTGMNLREYLNRRRICEFERIKTENASEPVYILAENCGFNNMKTFYRAYNEYVDRQS